MEKRVGVRTCWALCAFFAGLAFSGSVSAQCSMAGCLPAQTVVTPGPAMVCTDNVNGCCMIANATTVTMIGGAAGDYICGSANAQNMLGNGGADSIFGEGGNDTILGGAGDDLILGGDGNDIIQGDGDNDTILGEGGLDNISGGTGNDFLFGGDDADTINGDAGLDFITGDEGDDNLSGGDDADSIFGGGGADTLNGDGGNDTTLDGGAGDDIVNGGDGNDGNISGGDGVDQLSGGLGDDTLNGGPGADTLNGDDGMDTLNGDGDDDTINGGAGNDTANGGAGNDIINGGDDNDNLSGGTGFDTINGENGDDTLFGNSEPDVLDGGAGTDSLTGGAGNDTCLNGETTSTCELFSHVTLDSFGAFEEAGSVVLRWVTSSEAGTLGFHVYREQEEEWVSVHEGMLPGLISAPQGGVYELRDRDADVSETQSYLLVEVTSYGDRVNYGPFEVSAEESGVSLLGSANYARQAHAATVGPSLVQRAFNPSPPGSAEIVGAYFGVSETGLYAISAAELAGIFELSEAEVSQRLSAGQFALSESGNAIAWTTNATATELRFVGYAIQSLFTSQRIYRVALAQGVTMSSIDASPGVVNPAANVDQSLHFEEDLIVNTLIISDPDADYWFWQVVSAAPEMIEEASATFSIEQPAPGSSATLDLGLQGIMDGEHSVEVFVNDVSVAELAFNDQESSESSLMIPAGVLVDGENELRIVPTGPETSVLYLDEFDLSYTRATDTSTAALEFEALASESIELRGLASATPLLFNTTNSERPVVVQGFAVDEGEEEGSSDLSFAVVEGARYLAASAAEAKSAEFIRADAASDLHDTRHRAEYLVIAPDDFYASAQALVDYRQAAGLESMLVSLSDVYDEFAAGVPDPNAIRFFLTFAYESWKTKPRFAVLVGTGDFDYRNLQGFGGNQLPPILVSTQGGLFSADSYFGDVEGDRISEVLIGRLPVASTAELDDLIARIIAYEASDETLATDGSALLFADGEDPASDFALASDVISGAFADSWEINDVYRAELSSEEFRTALFDEIAQDPLLIHYLGHAGMNNVGKTEMLFSSDDVAAVSGSNDAGRPIYAFMSCLVSRFEIPGFGSLGEDLVNAEGGAIAVWGPSGLSIDEQAQQMSAAFIDAYTSGAYATLGEALREAALDVVELEGGTDMAAIYQLFGDPALRVNTHEEEGGSTKSCAIAWSRSATSSTWLLLFCGIAFLLMLCQRRKRRASS